MPYKIHKQYRLPGFDYAANGAYFITVVTKNRAKHFGEIQSERMQLSKTGKFVQENFKSIADKLSTIKVTEYSIMPDHIHLIVTIEKEQIKSNENYVDGLQPLTKDSVSSFMNHLKGKIKKWCNENGNTGFEWQARFYDRIIRDNKEYGRIAGYIQNNVINWEKE